ncbi:MAG: hypothetical protein HYS27_16650 [Deltaproteobacteria bacterium]|nr:hypothetical protein [Deltaproteobacteria bacterium]
MNPNVCSFSLRAAAVGAALTTALLAFAACDAPVEPVSPAVGAPDEDAVPLGPVVSYAPTEGVLLFPDDAPARIQGLPRAGAPVDSVRAELLSFVSAHGGARADTPLAFELSGKIDPASVPVAVELVRLDDGARLAFDVAITLGGRGARLTPRGPLEVGGRYALAVRGGAGGLRGTEQPARPSASFACMLALAGRDPADAGYGDACAEVPGADLDEHPSTTDALGALGALGWALAPDLDRLQELGVPAATLIALATFTVTDRPTALLDAETGVGPWPSALATDAQGRTTLPPVSLPGLDLVDLGEAVAAVPGFSTSSRMRVPYSCALDEEGGMPSLNSLDASAGFADVNVEPSRSADRRVAFLRKRPALAAASSFALVASSASTCGGAPVAPALDGALLRSRTPLAVDGQSTTALLTDAAAGRLEPVRARLAPLLDALDARGTPRGSVALAVPFDTLDPAAFIETHAAALAERGVAPTLSDVVVANPFDRGVWAVMPHVDTVVSGSYRSLEHIDQRTLRRLPGGPVDSEVPFVLTVPPHGDAPIPVVLFGHGLTTTKELAYLIADAFAGLGLATLAIDLPFHGARSVCTEDVHCALLQHCADDHTCRDGDDRPGSLAVVDSLWPDGPEVPLSTGAAFILIDDLVASRDHVLQGSVDLLQALRLLEGGALDATVPGMTLSRTDWSWFGVSLGGIYGATLAALTPSVRSFALNVPGADFVVILEQSSVISPLLTGSLDRMGIAPDSDAYRDYQDVAHLVLDPVDPLNLAPRATVARPSGWPEKRLLIQAAESDRVIPNAATHILAEVTGTIADEYTPLVSNHIFFFDPASFEGARARDDALRFLTDRP